MPKIKTHRGAAKRFSKTKNGKFKRSKAFNRHLKSAKSANRKRHLRKATMADASETNRLKHMLPYL